MPSETTAPAASGASSHERILAAAKQLFARRGYENTSTVAIARQAGTSESQLMKHFGSKEGLLETIFERGWRDLNQGMRAVQELRTPAAKLRALLDRKRRSNHKLTGVGFRRFIDAGRPRLLG